MLEAHRTLTCESCYLYSRKIHDTSFGEKLSFRESLRIAPHSSFIAPLHPFHDRLGEYPQTSHGITDHKDQHGVLAAQGQVRFFKRSQSHNVRQVYGDNVTKNNSDDGRDPDKPGAHDTYIDLIFSC